MSLREVLFEGCRPEVLAGIDGRIVAVGAAARGQAAKDALVVQLRGEAWPGLADSHIHLQGLAELQLTLDLRRTRSLEAVLAKARQRSAGLGRDAWLVGRGWYEDGWERPPHRKLLDEAGGGRPVALRRRDGHSTWFSSAALQAAGISGETPDPPGGVIERDADGEPNGVLREKAVEMAEAAIPPPAEKEFDAALARSLNELAALGLTAVHSMDPIATFSALQRLRTQRPLPLRVTYNLPVSKLSYAERLGIRSGVGDDELRIWGVKAFLDGSLGSGTAEMLDGSGVAVLPQPDLLDVVRRTADAELNLCLHAIGDGAVRRALDALEPARGAWRRWRPRIEHAQCVDPQDWPRFAAAGVIASMQPIHAVSDRDLADHRWAARTASAYAWRPLLDAGAVLAFGSDAPVDDASPLAGIEAATTWRRRAQWHPELALSRRAALSAYTRGAAYAAGMEDDLGALTRGRLCDFTVVENGRVTATVLGGRVTWRARSRQTPRKASPRSGRGAR